MRVALARTVVGAMLMLVALLAGVGGAAAQTWTLLRSDTVDLTSGKASIDLSANRSRSNAMKLVAKGGRLDASRVRITYSNGQIHYEEKGVALASGEASREIDVRQESLVIEQVLLTTTPAPRTVTVEVWARVTAAAPPALASNAKTAGARDADQARPPAAAARPPPPPAVAEAPKPSEPRGEAARPSLDKRYTAFPVLYGTLRARDDDRVKNGRKLATFTGEFGTDMLYGQAVVTIPIERQLGTIPRPEIDLLIAKIAFRSEDPTRDFTLASVDVTTREEFLAQLSKQSADAKTFKRQAFVFVHGYNVSFDDAVFRTAQIAHDLQFDGPAITFSWPSRGGMWDYRHDIDTSLASRDGLRRFLEMIAKETNVEAVNLVAHSMGNAPVLEMLSSNADVVTRGGSVTDLKLKEIILAAPDVSRDNFVQTAAKLKGLFKSPLTLYASNNDFAMQMSRAFSSGIVRAGDVPRTGPVVAEGVETIDISDASMGMFSTNHSTFAEREQLVKDIRMMFSQNVHPPHTRTPSYRLQSEGERTWWRFFKQQP